MKRIMLLGTACLLTLQLSRAQNNNAKKDSDHGRMAQNGEFKVKFGNSKDRKVVIIADNSEMKIEGYDGDEVQIQASGFHAPPERAKGLKPLYNAGVDNSGIGLSIEQEGNVLNITKATRQNTRYTIRIPRRVSLSYEQVNWQGDDVTVSNLEGDLEIKTTNSDINLEKVTGPVVASTTSGNIVIVYAGVEQSKPSSISNISGIVDVTLPGNTKANLRLKSITGEIYSDLDLSFNQNKGDLKRLGGGHTVEGAINGGGVEISLNTISSDIYLRKQK